MGMATLVVARFLVDRPLRPGMVRAILDTLTAQGAPYAPDLVRRSQDDSLRRLTGARSPRLLDEVAEGGAHTTFMRVAEALPQPVLSFAVSETPRTRPSRVTLTIPGDALGEGEGIDRLLGVCKGLYLFLESVWGVAGYPDPPDAVAPLQWANFLGPELVSRTGPARLLTSAAFMVEILPDGGVMLVTHPSPALAVGPEGTVSRHDLARTLGAEWVAITGRDPLRADGATSPPAAPSARGTRVE
jgi:hypothetical protein